MKTVVLYGRLADEFGARHRLAISSPAEAVSALEANNPGRFMRALREGHFRVGRTAEHSGFEESELLMQTGADEVHIEPVVAGAKNSRGKGAVTAILGVALIATAVVFSGGTAAAGLFSNMGATAFTVAGSAVTYGNIAMLGLALTLNGVATLLAPSMNATGPLERPDERPSFLFDGPVNMTEQGGPVPLLYGRMRVGSVVISAGLSSERMPV